MAPQLWVFILYLVLAAVVAGVFLEAIASTRRPREVEAGAVQRVRVRFFVLLTVVVLAALAITLTRLPYTLWADELPDRVVFVAGKQFAFAVAETPVGEVAQRAGHRTPATRHRRLGHPRLLSVGRVLV
ncbi:MAG: hypothetical protein L0221_15560, partial [Chloroflexi bacterium]|nr:hypothetical protein [Chloroflexota bacterium]